MMLELYEKKVTRSGVAIRGGGGFNSINTNTTVGTDTLNISTFSLHILSSFSSFFFLLLSTVLTTTQPEVTN